MHTRSAITASAHSAAALVWLALAGLVACSSGSTADAGRDIRDVRTFDVIVPSDTRTQDVASDAGADEDADVTSDVEPDPDVSSDVAPDPDVASDVSPDPDASSDVAPDPDVASDVADTSDAGSPDASDASDASDSADADAGCADALRTSRTLRTQVRRRPDASACARRRRRRRRGPRRQCGWTTSAPGATTRSATRPRAAAIARLEVAGAEYAWSVAFSADGRYALVLDRVDGVRIFDTARSDTRRFVLETSSRDPIYWQDVAFSPEGDQALLVGTRIGDATASEVWVFDAAAYRADDTAPDAAFTQLSGAASREFAEAVTFAGPRHGDGRPLILSRSDRFPYTRWLDALDLESGTTELLVASATSAGCQDIAYVENEFGNAGYLIVCGVNGYDGLYWTEVGGAFELRTDLGANSLGNTSRIVPRPQGDYALVIQNSSDRVHRFEAGQMNASSEAPWFRTRRLWAGAFDPDGRRALLTGKYQSVSGAEFEGVFEARDGAYSCPCAQRRLRHRRGVHPELRRPAMERAEQHAARRRGLEAGLRRRPDRRGHEQLQHRLRALRDLPA